MPTFNLYMKFESTYQDAGHDYYVFEAAIIDGDMLPEFGLGLLCNVLSLFIPELGLINYFPQELTQGQDVAGYTVPENCYLLSAKVEGGYKTPLIGGYVFPRAKLVYVDVPPDTGGITWLVPYAEPTPLTHLESWRSPSLSYWYPLDTSESWVDVAGSDVMAGISTLTFNWLWIFAGSTVTDVNALANANQHPFLADLWYGTKGQRIDTQNPYGVQQPLFSELVVSDAMEVDYSSQNLITSWRVKVYGGPAFLHPSTGNVPEPVKDVPTLPFPSLIPHLIPRIPTLRGYLPRLIISYHVSRLLSIEGSILKIDDEQLIE